MLLYDNICRLMGSCSRPAILFACKKYHVDLRPEALTSFFAGVGRGGGDEHMESFTHFR